MSDFFKDIMSSVDNEFASCADDGIIAGDVDGYFDTGSYALNALVSGSIYKGFPKNKIIALAGEQAVGKSFFCLTTMKYFLNDNPKGGVFLFESESALTKQTLVDFGIDTKRVFVFPVETVQQFRNQCLVIVNNYLKQSEKDRQPILMVLDSLGMLSTAKEMEDIEAGKDTRDMTRAQLIRGAFRVLTLKLGKAGIPLILTNHVYQTMDLYSRPEMSGGTGVRYACSLQLDLSKRKEKDGNDFIGNVIHCKVAKGRLTKEGSTVDALIRFDTGLDRWYGMATFAVESGALKKVGNMIETPSGKKLWPKQIMKEPEVHFTKEVMDKIDEWCQKKFCYGNGIDIPEIDEIEEDTNE